MTDFSHGAVVTDRDGDADELVVVNTPPTTADDWDVAGRGLLSLDNPDYPADDAVVCGVFHDTLAAVYPYYSGVRPIPLAELSERGVDFYAFPASRLEHAGSLDPFVVDIERVERSPYHARTFSVADNREFIDETAAENAVNYPLLVRVVGDGPRATFEILNGHKRLWTAKQAGLDEVRVLCLHIGVEEGTRAFVNAHFDGYNAAERSTATAAIRERLGVVMAREVLPELAGTERHRSPDA